MYMTLKEIEIGLKQGEIQLGYNANLELQILMMPIELEFSELGEGDKWNVFFIEKGQLVKSEVVGFSNKVGYYTAADIAMQDKELPSELKIEKR